jgi:hypothetical protein
MKTKTSSKGMLWTGRVISILCIIFMFLDGGFKVIKAKPSMEGSIQLGILPSHVQGIGFILLVCTILYTIPRTAILGAILLTGYLGGAIAIMARIETPYWFPMIMGMMVWAGLFLRDEKLRALVPLRKQDPASPY